MEKMSNMLHMYKMYDAARKSMYVAMECESDPTSAHSAYKGALQTFEEFLNAAEKEHGMYRDLEKKAMRMKETCQQKLQSFVDQASPNDDNISLTKIDQTDQSYRDPLRNSTVSLMTEPVPASPLSSLPILAPPQRLRSAFSSPSYPLSPSLSLDGGRGVVSMDDEQSKEQRAEDRRRHHVLDELRRMNKPVIPLENLQMPGRADVNDDTLRKNMPIFSSRSEYAHTSFSARQPAHTQTQEVAKQKLYACKFMCGFTGAVHDVVVHELACASKEDTNQPTPEPAEAQLPAYVPSTTPIQVIRMTDLANGGRERGESSHNINPHNELSRNDDSRMRSHNIFEIEGQAAGDAEQLSDKQGNEHGLFTAGVPFTLTLALDFKSIGDKEALKNDVIIDVANAAKIEEEHVKIIALRAGSVIVDMLIASRAGDAQKIVKGLEEQFKLPRSPLMQGKVTSKTKSIECVSALESDREDVRAASTTEEHDAAGASVYHHLDDIVMMEVVDENTGRLATVPRDVAKKRGGILLSSHMNMSRHEWSNTPSPIPEARSKIMIDVNDQEHGKARAWSHANNKHFCDSQLLNAATDHLVALTNLRSQHLEHYIEEFIEKPEMAPKYIQTILSMSAQDCATFFDIKRLPRSTKIMQAAWIISKSQYVVISGEKHADVSNGLNVRDAIWNKQSLFIKMLACTNFGCEISEILDDVPELPTLNMESSDLAEVLRVMFTYHTEVVGLVNDAGSIHSVVQLSDIFQVLLREISSLQDESLVTGQPGTPGTPSSVRPGTPATPGGSFSRPRKGSLFNIFFPSEIQSANEERISSANEERISCANEEDLLAIDDETDMQISRKESREKALSMKDAAKQATQISPVQELCQSWVESFCTENLIIMLVMVDMSLTVVDFFDPKPENFTQIDNPIVVCTGAILFVFSYDSIVRVMGYRMSILNGQRPMDSADVLITIMSVIVYLWMLLSNYLGITKLMTIARMIRLTRILKFGVRLRKIVGHSRRRFKQDGFDLDLTYITPSVIAMSLPAVGKEALYRNPIDDVARFFHTYHYNEFLIFNLCSERKYDTSLFDGRVERILVDDHNPPLLDMLVKFVCRAESFMKEKPKSLIAVHCKGGKGRTGTFVCAWLLYSTHEDTTQSAMEYFAKRRTGPKAKKTQAVGGASQRRYLEYFSKVLANGGYRETKLRLLKMRLHTCPHMDLDQGCDPWISILQGGSQEQGGGVIYTSLNGPVGPSDDPIIGGKWTRDERFASGRGAVLVHMKRKDKYRDFNIDMDVVGDIRIFLHDHDTSPPRDEICCFLWFHTGFIAHSRAPDKRENLCGQLRLLSGEECADLSLPQGSFSLIFQKSEIDMAWSDQKCKVFDKDFKLEFFFESVPSENQAFQEDIPEEAFSPASSTEVGTDFTFLPEHNVSALKEHFPCANLGAWRPMRKAALYTRTRVEKEKCCNYATVVQPQSFTIDSEEFCSLVPIPDNLCVDTGPPVEHENVQLHSLDVNHMVQNSGNEAKINLKRIRNLRESRSILKRTGSNVSNRVRAIVSLNKKRFQIEGFDLDLTYITPRVIAMGYPAATGIEGTYRNSREEVYRFFQERHSGHFRIINLVLERGYDLTLYHNSVARYGFRDHNAPALELLLPCCAHMHRYLQADKDNIVAVHCKAGKGRTGLVVVCYLLYSGLQNKASLARNFYDRRRCHDGKGLTILSQVRYAHYFEKCLARIKSGVECPVSETQSPAIVILAVAMHGMPSFSSNESEVLLQIVVRSEDDHEEYVIYKSQPCSLNRKGRVWYLEPNKNGLTRLHPDQNAYNNMSKFQNMKNDANIANEGTTDKSPELVSQAPDKKERVGGVRVAGDIKFEFCRQMSGSKQKYLCHTWTHSQFMDDPPNIMEDQQWREPDCDVSQWSTKYPPAKSHHLSDEETRVLNQGAGLDLPNGSSSLSISKHEIEGAAQDKRDIHFPGHFKIQVFWKYLPNQKGTGDTLAAARKAAKTATNLGIDDCIPPLEKEKAEYSEYLRICRKKLTKPMSFTQHILSHSINQKEEELLAHNTKPFRSLRKLSNPENMYTPEPLEGGQQAGPQQIE